MYFLFRKGWWCYYECSLDRKCMSFLPSYYIWSFWHFWIERLWWVFCWRYERMTYTILIYDVFSIECYYINIYSYFGNDMFCVTLTFFNLYRILITKLYQLYKREWFCSCYFYQYCSKCLNDLTCVFPQNKIKITHTER